MLSAVPDENSWPDEILELAVQEFDCVIDVFTPAVPGEYDPTTDDYTGTGYVPETVLISARDARAQHLRLPLEGMAAGERTRRRRYRFQFEYADSDPVLTEGLAVRVTSTVRNQALTSYVFQISDAGGSDHSPLRTLEAISEMGVVNE